MFGESQLSVLAFSNALQSCVLVDCLYVFVNSGSKCIFLWLLLKNLKIATSYTRLHVFQFTHVIKKNSLDADTLCKRPVAGTHVFF